MKRQNIYKKLIQRAKGLIRAARIPRSFSKRRNNVFSNEKHICMQVLKQFARVPYRKLPDFCELLQEVMNLPRKPNFTTLNKFALRVKPAWFEQLIVQIISSVQSGLVAIDGTGFSLNATSRYYETISGKKKEFMQFNAAMELKHKLITAARIRRKRRNENIDFKSLVCRTSRQMSISTYLADKAYDSEKNHELIRKLGAELIAPLKNKRKGERTHGWLRRKLEREFPEAVYRKRCLIESGFSALKRKHGDVIYARKFISQKNELLCRVLAYNLGIIVNLFVLEIYFLQSLYQQKI